MVGNGPNTVSGSAVSNTELSESSFEPPTLICECQNKRTHRVFQAELTESTPKLSEAQ